MGSRKAASEGPIAGFHNYHKITVSDQSCICVKNFAYAVTYPEVFGCQYTNMTTQTRNPN